MPFDFKLYGRSYRAGLAWDRAGERQTGMPWILRQLRMRKARCLVEQLDGWFGFDTAETRKPALLPAILRHCGPDAGDSLIIVLAEDGVKSNANGRYALIVTADGSLVAGGGDLVFDDGNAALAHVEALAADRDWDAIVYDNRIAALAEHPSPWRSMDFSTLSPASTDYLGAPPLLLGWAVPGRRRLGFVAATLVVLCVVAWWGAGEPGLRQAPPPRMNLPIKTKPSRIAPDAFINACAKALNTHYPGLMGWTVERVECFLKTPPQGGGASQIAGTAQLLVTFNPVIDRARARLVAYRDLPKTWDWFIVDSGRALASTSLAVDEEIFSQPTKLEDWRSGLDAGFGPYVRSMTIDLDAGTVSINSPYPLDILAMRTRNIPGLELTEITDDGSSFRLEGRFVRSGRL